MLSPLKKFGNFFISVLEWGCGYLDVFLIPIKMNIKELHTRLSENKQAIKLRASTVYPP
ncbi:hypothetical protein D3C75_636830 [compost metagenome]